MTNWGALHLASFRNELRRVVSAQPEHSADQVEHRVHGRAPQDSSRGTVIYEIECRITNPDTDYDSGWYLADVFSIGPRGRVIR